LTVRTHVTAAAGCPHAYASSRDGDHAGLDFRTARVLDQLAAGLDSAEPARDDTGLRRIDLFGKARTLITLDRAWRTELAKASE